MSATTVRSGWRKWRRRIVVSAVVFVVLSVASVEITSQPRFCNSCHIMEPYYASWTEDVHKDISCVECHIEPGAQSFVAAKLNGLGQVVDDWLNRTSTKPSASVSDLSCSREGCHDPETLKTHETTSDSFLFQHGKHQSREYLGIEIHCSTCHSHVKGDRHFEVNTNVCITCHLTNNRSGLIVKASDNGFGPHAPGTDTVNDPASAPSVAADQWTSVTVAPKDCEKCHTVPQEPFEHEGVMIDHAVYLSFGASCDSCHDGVTAPPNKIDDAQCLSCHVFGLEMYENTESIHRIHSEGEHKVECFNCHGVTRHGPVAQSMQLYELNCADCHTGQHAVQRMTYMQQEDLASDAVEVPAAISPMFLVHVDCTGCHIEPHPVSSNPRSGATVARAVTTACDNCHAKGLGAQMVPMWQRDTKALYDLAQSLLPDSADPWDASCPDAAPLIERARSLLELVRVDSSWGVHNPRYTERLLEQARTSALEAREVCDSAKEAQP